MFNPSLDGNRIYASVLARDQDRSLLAVGVFLKG